MPYSPKEKELLLVSIERSMKALAKCVTQCLKEKQTGAAEAVNADINLLQKLDKELRNPQ